MGPDVQHPVPVHVPSWVKKFPVNEPKVLSQELPVPDWQVEYAVEPSSLESQVAPQSSSAGAEVSQDVPTQTPSAVLS